MRRERSATTIRIVVLVALASVLAAAVRSALATIASARAHLHPCAPQGYGLEAAPLARATKRPTAVDLTVGWAAAAERRHPCRLRTTIDLDISGPDGVGASATWKVNAVLRPWGSVVDTWAWQNWCQAAGKDGATVEFSIPGGSSVRESISEPPACKDSTASSVVADLGVGEKHVRRPSAPIPAHILPKDTPAPFQSELMKPKNAWLVSDGYTLVAVYAGAPGHDPSIGRFAVVRQNLIFGIQYFPPDFVDVGKVGAIRITRAPRGKSRETSAQYGRIAFVAKDGTKGFLSLIGDRIRIVRR